MEKSDSVMPVIEIRKLTFLSESIFDIVVIKENKE